MKHIGISTVAFAAIASFLLAGCATPPPKVISTGLEQQQYQSQEFEAVKRLAFASTMSVLQDAGYIIGSADFDTGFITAKAPTNAKFDLWYGSTNVGAEVSAFIEEFGTNKTKIRLAFVNKRQRKSAWNPYQDVIEESGVQDASVYKKVFDKIGEAIFIRQKQT